MTTEDLVMVIDKTHFIVKLHSSKLEVDLKEGVRKHIEDFVEANPHLRDTLGTLFQFAIPLDVPLKDIHSVKLDNKGQVKIIIPHRRDLTIPLEQEEAQKLINKLNELIPIEKEREIERVMADAAARREEAERRGEEEFMTRDHPSMQK
jgi:hypothetical protein